MIARKRPIIGKANLDLAILYATAKGDTDLRANDNVGLALSEGYSGNPQMQTLLGPGKGVLIREVS